MTAGFLIKRSGRRVAADAPRRTPATPQAHPQIGHVEIAPHASPPLQLVSQTTLLNLQRLVGNQALQRFMTGPTMVQRKIVTVEGEEVDVADKKEKEETDEAKAIFAELKSKYSIAVSSPTVIEGIKEEYPDVKAKVKNALKTRRWRMIELRALLQAAKYYAPILGAERANSTRKGAGQEVTSVGKAEYSIDEDEPTGKLDKDTLGEYFGGKKAMGLFKPSEGHTADFASEADQLVGTFVHEMGHGLLVYSLKDFIKESDGYWTDADTASGKKGAEKPITKYGKDSAEEDLCETAMMYFVAPARLEKGAPKRFAFMAKVGKDWLPPVKAAPIVQPTPAASPTATPKVPVGTP